MKSSIRPFIFRHADLLVAFLVLVMISCGSAKEESGRYLHPRQLMSGKGKSSTDCVTLGSTFAPTSTGEGKGGKGSKGGKGKGSSSEAPVRLESFFFGGRSFFW